MTDERTLERAARSFIEPGPTRAPEEVLERTLLLIQTTSQERGLRIPWRFKPMTTQARLAATAVICVIAIGGAAVLLRPSGSTAGVAPPPQASIVAGPSASSSSTAPPIADGTYVTPSIKVSDILAVIEADEALNAAQRTELIDVSLGIRGRETFVVSLVLQNGQWTQHQAVDGVDLIGSRATYSFLDADTLIVRDQVGLGGFQITQVEDGFRLKALSPEPTEQDALTVRILFESAPFIRVP
jgi:hypothetical protein